MTPNREITKAARSLAGQWGGSRRLCLAGYHGVGLPPGRRVSGLRASGPRCDRPDAVGLFFVRTRAAESGEASLGRLFGGFDGFGQITWRLGRWRLFRPGEP